MASEASSCAKTAATSISCRLLANEMELDVAEIFLDQAYRAPVFSSRHSRDRAAAALFDTNHLIASH